MPARVASSSRRKPGTRRRAPAAKPDIFGTNLLAPRTQIITQRAGLGCHRLMVRLSPPTTTIDWDWLLIRFPEFATRAVR